MRTETITKNIYTYYEATPELKSKIVDHFASCPFHFEHSLQERIETLVQLSNFLDTDLDYSLSCTPSRDEFINIGEFDDKLLSELDAEKYPLTGCCYDHDLINDIKNKGITKAFSNYITAIHTEYEYTLSDEYLSDICEANGYEFYEDGTMV